MRSKGKRRRFVTGGKRGIAGAKKSERRRVRKAASSSVLLKFFHPVQP